MKRGDRNLILLQGNPTPRLPPPVFAAGDGSVIGCSHHRTAGFSLLEVMVAVMILGVALVGLTQGILAALGSNKDSELLSTAAMLAAGRIELLRADSDFSDGTTEGQEEGGQSHYKWKQTISATGTEGLHEVLVEIEHSQSGKTIYSLQTMLFLPPLDATPEKPGDSKRSSKSKSKTRRNRA